MEDGVGRPVHRGRKRASSCSATRPPLHLRREEDVLLCKHQQHGRGDAPMTEFDDVRDGTCIEDVALCGIRCEGERRNDVRAGSPARASSGEASTPGVHGRSRSAMSGTFPLETSSCSAIEGGGRVRLLGQFHIGRPDAPLRESAVFGRIPEVSVHDFRRNGYEDDPHVPAMVGIFVEELSPRRA